MKVIDMKAARKAAEQRKHRDTVLDIYDQMDRATKRTQREQAADVRRKARNKL
ncbi:hypothetical protein V4E86_22410 [Burkholderia pseudomallei]|uniref:Uncharacterized protein n=1 Tax=Burkholderia pseudomallei TaxID=28450 RepID=A0A8A4DMZ0_BURPE|nr:hypothetical protein [Burkholderia pseudomallei]AFR18517.1 hypothetical protein BPC006_II0585 [Burkholderia pseudomallei BPC006]AIP06964.1 hypothetical protein DP55_5145 [Burkholderia pseudomallei]EEP52198.1 hypothetical protein GBP346_B3210 [Burkholderia pseudomallei MSHR346]EQA85187.1 hypothetical protein M218_30815 [Burkholderia pseudomallei MSHR338]KGS33386.1 hypothetical protein X941_6056 [Burkholderia pseudomallei MSHR5569]